MAACPAGTWKPVSAMPSGSSTPFLQEAGEALAGDDGDQMAEHVGGDAVVPCRAGLREQAAASASFSTTSPRLASDIWKSMPWSRYIASTSVASMKP